MRVLKILAFTELEPFAGFLLAEFLTFNHSRVAGHKALGFKKGFVFFIDLYQGS